MWQRGLVLAGLGGGVLLAATAVLSGPGFVRGQQAVGGDRPSIAATLMVLPHQPRIQFETNEPQPDPKTDLNTQAGLIKSRRVLDAAVRDPKVAGLKLVQGLRNPAAWLERNLQVEARPDSMLIRIALAGEQNAETAALINAVVDQYFRLVVAGERQKRFERLDALRKLWTRYQDELRQKRRTLRQLASAGHDGSMVELERRLLSELLAAINQERIRLKLERIEGEARLERTKDEAQKAEIQERLAVIARHAQLLAAELSQTAEKLGGLDVDAVDLKGDQDELEIAEATARSVQRELQRLEVELMAPPRIVVIDDAAP